MLELKDKWVWDSWYVEDNGLWHAFFLQADRSLGDPELRHWNVTHGHATSTDLMNWDYKGTVFGPSPDPAFDDFTTWTSFVVKDDSGVWNLFYTGTSKSEDGKFQRIGRATSSDLENWERQGIALDLKGPNSEHYESLNLSRWKDSSLRDPWIIRDPEGDGWLMYFTARSPNPEDTLASGAIGLARSNDLTTWTLEPPVFVGGFGEIEVPSVFQKNGKWYCLFCTTEQFWSEEFRENYDGEGTSGNHYLIADHHLGPWKIAPGPFLDGSKTCDRYAPRWIGKDGRDYYIACNRGPDDTFEGTLIDPIELGVESNGLLKFC